MKIGPFIIVEKNRRFVVTVFTEDLYVAIMFLIIFFQKGWQPLILLFRPKDWYEEPEKGDRRIKRLVNVEQCNCKREILSHTMVTYEGGDHGNSSISTCSEHSFHRGAKQKVNLFLTPSKHY